MQFYNKKNIEKAAVNVMQEVVMSQDFPESVAAVGKIAGQDA